MEHLIGQGPLSSEKLCQLLLATLRFPSPQRVLMTAAAAVGDLSRRAFKHIKPMAPQLLREVFIVYVHVWCQYFIIGLIVSSLLPMLLLYISLLLLPVIHSDAHR